MISEDDLQPPEATQRALEEIVRAGPRGAFALAGTATAIVVAIWFLFYFLVFVPRGTMS